MLRTHRCGEPRTEDCGQQVALAGWVHRRRDHGPIPFIGLRILVADQPAVVAASLHKVRCELGQRLQLADPDLLTFACVVDFPMVEWNVDEGRGDPMHHPFCIINPEGIAKLDTAPGTIRAAARRRRARDRSHRDVAGRHQQHPRCDRVPHEPKGRGAHDDRSVAGGRATALRAAPHAAAGSGGVAGERGERVVGGVVLACQKKVQREHLRKSGRPMHNEAFGGARISSFA